MASTKYNQPSTSTNEPSTSTNEPSTSTKKIMVLDGCFRTHLNDLDKTYNRQNNRPHLNDLDTTYNRQNDRLRINTTKPDIVQKVHEAFLEAGANVIRTNTYRASEKILRSSFKYKDDKIKEFFEKSVENARKAIEKYTNEKRKDLKDYMVVGSCGSYTDCRLLKAKTKTREDYKDYHILRAKSLIEAKADILAFESIPVAEEAYAIVELMNELEYSQYWISFKCVNKKLFCDSELSAVARKCYEKSQQKLCAVGINCVDPTVVRSILSTINDPNKHEIMIPLVAYPHLGIGCPSDPKWKPMICVTWSPKLAIVPVPVLEWLNMNVRYIGGCCRVTPNNIKSIREMVNKHDEKSRFQS